jgi:cytochrome c5
VGSGVAAILVGILVAFAGCLGVASLAGGLETLSCEASLPFERQMEDPLPIIDPAAPVPAAGWSWGDVVRGATCPACHSDKALSRFGGSSRAFYDWYALFPPVE